MVTGLIWDERLMWHDTGNHFGPDSKWLQPLQHPENDPGKRRIKSLLDASGLTDQLSVIAPEQAEEADVLRAHTPEHLAHIKQVSDAGGGNVASRLGMTRVGAGGFDLAMLSAGATITAVNAVLNGDVENAYVLSRPPGHHAEPGEAMGFCIFANAAIGGLHALDMSGFSRIAFVDWDAHHGNGTQAVFWNDPRALTISLHQDASFPPWSGFVDEIGEGPGTGHNINIPLPPGSGEGAYIAAFERVVLPALEAYKPELIIVPSGFDAGGHDPLARMMLTSNSYRVLTEMLKSAASKLCDGRLVMVHEGGYAPHMVPFMGLAVMEAMSGIKTPADDPFLPGLSASPHNALQPHQDEAIVKAEENGLAALVTALAAD
jgi:acetoin utilization deacetylase AcuC-like enzyme